MQIFAKSALDKDLMKIKMYLGADAIEVQLLNIRGLEEKDA